MSITFNIIQTSMRGQVILNVTRPHDKGNIPYVALQMPEDFANYIRNSATSYSKHFGNNAVKAAEEDMLGRALKELDTVSDYLCNQERDLMEESEIQDRIFNILSLTKSSKP